MLIFGDTLINMKTENRRKKFLHNLKALKKFLQSPKAKKKSYQHKIAHPPAPPPPQKNGPSLITAQRSKMTTSEWRFQETLAFSVSEKHSFPW